MPELPEVETLCRQLQEKIAGEKILSSKVYDPKLAHVPDLRGRIVRAVRRNGKMIEFIIDAGESIFVHLRMSGRLVWHKEKEMPKYARWCLSFPAAQICLVDPRRFATIAISSTEQLKCNNDLLLDFDQSAFITKNGGRKTKVKNLLMDQRAINGIGNIYACEILHCSGIHPDRTAASLAGTDWERIFGNAKNILKKAITKRGTSISDWRDLDGRPGENQHELKAYGREGKKCFLCKGTIQRLKQGGRSTYYCPCCQK